MMPSGMTATWLSAVSVPLATTSAPPLNVSGTRPVVGPAMIVAGGRCGRLSNLEAVHQRSPRLLDGAVHDHAVHLQLFPRNESMFDVTSSTYL